MDDRHIESNPNLRTGKESVENVIRSKINTRLYRFSIRFTGFYWVLLGFTVIEQK